MCMAVRDFESLKLSAITTRPMKKQQQWRQRRRRRRWAKWIKMAKQRRKLHVQIFIKEKWGKIRQQTFLGCRKCTKSERTHTIVAHI